MDRRLKNNLADSMRRSQSLKPDFPCPAHGGRPDLGKSANVSMKIVLGLFVFFVFQPMFGVAQVKTSVTEPYETSKIAAAEQGVIQQIEIREGQTITAGEVLARMDQGILPESRKLAELRANSESRINATKAGLKLRLSQKENMDELIKAGHANPFEVQQVVAKFEQATAEYEGALEERSENRAELDRIDAEIVRRSIRSPISGIVTEIHKRHGEFVSANDPIFATVVQLDQLRVRFYLNAETTNRLAAGQRVNIYVGKEQTEMSGVIEFVSPVVEPDTGFARVNVLIANPDLSIRSGIVCAWEKNLRTTIHANHLQVPRR